MKKRYITIQPLSIGSFEEEWRQCMAIMQNSCPAGFTIFRLTVFIASDNEADFLTRQKEISYSILEGFGDKCPTFTVLAQAPMAPYTVNVEIALIEEKGFLRFKRYGNKPYVLIENEEGHKELWASNMSSLFGSDDIQSMAEGAFSEMHDILEAESMNFDHLVRQWNYVPDILAYKKEEEKNYQHYQIFNEVRNLFYGRFRKVQGFPAATGIGVAYGPVSIDFSAIDHLGVISVQNPSQINPYEYGQAVLKGANPFGKDNNQPPQFERGKLVIAGNESTFYISGTASISGEITIGVEDAALQTHNTIDLISKLASVSNLKNHINSSSSLPSNILSLRVYVKYQKDMELVKNICLKSFGESAAISLVQADICRDDLLVEIEGISTSEH